jgi:hypothetical protein
VLATNPCQVQKVMETKINARMNYVLNQRTPSSEKWFWSHSKWTWVDVETHRQEDYNCSSNRARTWCRRHLTRQQWQEDWDPLWVRFHHDEEYLAQMVVRDSLSPDPTLLSPDVQAKARRVAERTGALAAILQFHAVAYANMKASADDGTCKAQEEGGGNSIDAWLFMLFIFILGMAIASLVNHVWKWLKPKGVPQRSVATQTEKSERSIATQSQVTYTYVRGVQDPRFLPLPEHSHGIFN